LEFTEIKADYENAVYWLTRLLAHFPAREVGKDGVIISDIASAAVGDKSSLIAIAHTCDDLWRGATKEDPFLPPSGEILSRILQKTSYYKSVKSRILKFSEKSSA